MSTAIAMKAVRSSDIDRFKSKIKINARSGCWIWCGHIEKNRYGRFALAGRMRWAHICSYRMFVGEVGEGLELDHLCRNPACVNPSHLEAVTHKTNMERAELAGAGAAAFHKRKTHCPSGHQYAGENLVTWGNYRYCRICQSKYKKAYKERMRRAKNLR
jgi:hypothetical protein